MQIAGEDFLHLLFQLVPQMSVVKKLDGLFQTHSNKEPDDNRCNMNEEIFPTVRCFMRCVNFEHGR